MFDLERIIRLAFCERPNRGPGFVIDGLLPTFRRVLLDVLEALLARSSVLRQQLAQCDVAAALRKDGAWDRVALTALVSHDNATLRAVFARAWKVGAPDLVRWFGAAARAFSRFDELFAAFYAQRRSMWEVGLYECWRASEPSARRVAQMRQWLATNHAPRAFWECARYVAECRVHGARDFWIAAEAAAYALEMEARCDSLSKFRTELKRDGWALARGGHSIEGPVEVGAALKLEDRGSVTELAWRTFAREKIFAVGFLEPVGADDGIARFLVATR